MGEGGRKRGGPMSRCAAATKALDRFARARPVAMILSVRISRMIPGGQPSGIQPHLQKEMKVCKQTCWCNKKKKVQIRLMLLVNKRCVQPKLKGLKTFPLLKFGSAQNSDSRLEGLETKAGPNRRGSRFDLGLTGGGGGGAALS